MINLKFEMQGSIGPLLLNVGVHLLDLARVLLIFMNFPPFFFFQDWFVAIFTFKNTANI